MKSRAELLSQLLLMLYLLIGLFAFLGGFAGSAYFLYEFYCAIRSLFWPTTEGIIKKSDTHFNSETYDVLIAFQYSINGHDYSGTRVAFVTTPDNIYYFAKRIVRRYPIGSSVQVYYAPDNPTLSVLERGISPLRLVFKLTHPQKF